MRKILLLTILFVGCLTSAKAQYTYIEYELAYWMRNHGYVSCFQSPGSDNLDTTCTLVTMEDSLVISNNMFIDTLRDLRYFKNLQYLELSLSQLSGITRLPDSLKTLVITNCPQLDSLPVFTPGLKVFRWKGDLISPVFTPLPGGLEVFSLEEIYPNGSTFVTQTLPALPAGLKEFTVAGGSIPSLPPLPAGLTVLNVPDNVLTNLPTLPAGLTYLNVSHNALTTLPALPSTLQHLYCTNNDIAGVLPTLPLPLKTLVVDLNEITALPNVPPSLNFVNCGYNLLTELVLPPGNYTLLNCEHNNIDTLLLAGKVIDEFNCSYNNISYIDTVVISAGGKLLCRQNNLSHLPHNSSLTYLELDCSYNHLTDLTVKGTWITCSHNNLVNLNYDYHNFCELLDCSFNSLQHINLVQGDTIRVTRFFCDSNNLEYPLLTGAANGCLVVLDRFDCSNNANLTSVPQSSISPTLTQFICSNTAISCFPVFNNNFINVLQFQNCPVYCLSLPISASSSSPPTSNFPLCDFTYNPSDCKVANVTGKVILDIDLNCSYNPNNDSTLGGGLKVQLFQNGVLLQQVYTDYLGRFGFIVPAGWYEVRIDTAGTPYNLHCGYVPVNAPSASVYPLLSCKPQLDLVAKTIVRTSGLIFPGQIAHFKAVVGTSSNTVPYPLMFGQVIADYCQWHIPATVTLVMSGPASFNSIVPTPDVQSGDSVTWYAPDISLFPFPNMALRIDSTAIAGNQICFDLAISTTLPEYTLTNNQKMMCFNVVNSYDPNEKEVSPRRSIEIGEWLDYTIHFQNTGNAPAINIKLMDTLDLGLDVSSFQLLAFSHHNITQVFNNGVVQFNFPNINLPDSFSNEPASHGFVQYRIKTRMDDLPGFVIYNKASIYFDFNTPVVTNTVESRNCTGLMIGNIIRQICVGDSFMFGMQTITAPGVYIDSLLSTAGCDSVTHLTVSYDMGSNNIMQAGLCPGGAYNFEGEVINQPGTYYHNYTNINGCDSIHTLELTALPATYIDVLDSADVLYANTNAALLQWFNCGTQQVVPNATAAVFQPPSNGFYTCIAYSACGNDTAMCTAFFMGIDNLAGNTFSLLPNPAHNSVSLQLQNNVNAGLKIFDVVGAVVQQQTIQQAITQIDISQLPAGIYYVQVETEKGIGVKKLMVE